MTRIGNGLAALALATLAGAASAQTPARDKLLHGAWICSVSNTSVPFDHVDAQFDPGGVMLLKFWNADPNVKMSFALTGQWTYTAATDTFGETITGARIADMVVRGQPLARANFPGGEPAINKIEQEFMQQYATSPIYFTKVTASELLLTDTEQAKISCHR